MPAGAAEPRSAIPWLSQSIEIGKHAAAAEPAAPGGAARPGRDEITVTPLGEISRDAVGLLPPETTGFAKALWGPDPAPQVRAAIEAQGGRGVPEARALFHRLLLAEADPPQDAAGGSSVLVARIDRLLEMGALEEAGALIDLAGPDTPELFRRWFDVGLLLDRGGAALRGAAAESGAVADAAGAGLLPGARRRLERGGDHPDRSASRSGRSRRTSRRCWRGSLTRRSSRRRRRRRCRIH